MDHEKLSENLERLHSDSFAWAMRCCYEDKEAAKEVLQSTYLKVLEGKAVYNAKSRFKTWLFAVIRFTSFEYFKSEQKRSRLKEEWRSETAVPTQDRSGSSQQQIFKQVLKKLSPQQRQVLHLVFYQNCTINEAAQIMNIELGTARTHYERGKVQLRKRLAPIKSSIHES